MKIDLYLKENLNINFVITGCNEENVGRSRKTQEEEADHRPYSQDLLCSLKRRRREMHRPYPTGKR